MLHQKSLTRDTGAIVKMEVFRRLAIKPGTAETRRAPLKVQPSGVLCVKCGCKLSRYRDPKDRLCSPCQSKDPWAEETPRRQQRRKRMSVTPEQREALKVLEPEGWSVEGTSNGHLVIRHPLAGKSRLSGTPGGGNNSYLKNDVANARRKVRVAEASAGDCIAAIRKKFNVPDNSYADVDISFRAEVQEWTKKHPKIGQSPDAIIQALKSAGLVQSLVKGRGNKIGRWRIFGANYVPGGLNGKPTPGSEPEIEFVARTAPDEPKEDTPSETIPEEPLVEPEQAPVYLETKTKVMDEMPVYAQSDGKLPWLPPELVEPIRDYLFGDVLNEARTARMDAAITRDLVDDLFEETNKIAGVLDDAVTRLRALRKQLLEAHDLLEPHAQMESPTEDAEAAPSPAVPS